MKRMIGCLLVMAAALAAETPQELFQKALVKERSEGNLKEAIQLYERAAEAAGKDRALAAKALVEAGECYRKLGDAEARKLFERVINEYGDQKEEVTLARARLGHSESGGVVAKQVWTGPKVDVYGSVSSDGRYLSFVDWQAGGKLALHDLVSGADRLLTGDGEAEYSTISKDGKMVAFAWFKKDVYRYEVRLADLVGDPKPRRLFDSEEVLEISPYDWSPDGKWIAVSVRRIDHTAQIGLISVPEGSLRVLKSVDWRGSTRMFFSPDGRFLAYDVPTADAGGQRDVFLLAVDGSREIPAVVDPNQDVVMGWSADGKLLFASDRTGSMDLWALPFRDGKIQGPPELLKTDIGKFESSMGITAAGALYFGRTGRSHDVQVVPVDWAAGKLLGPAITPFKRFVGANSSPSWSGNSKFLSCRSLRDPSGANTVLAVLNIESGQITAELQPPMANIGDAQLSPDGRSFAVTGHDLRGRRGIFQVDAKSNAVKPIALVEEPGGARPDSLVGPEWSPDGTKIYFIKISYQIPRNGQVAASRAYIEKDLASGKEREIMRRTDLGIIRISPDGRWIATTSSESTTHSSTVLLIPVDGGDSRELMSVKQPGQLRVPGWAPDGRAVIVSRIPANGSMPAQASSPEEAWRIPIDGQQARKLDIDLNSLKSIGPFRFSPDGRYIAFLTGGASRSEVSVLENFLPGPAGRKR